jgi:hypothetical protein
MALTQLYPWIIQYNILSFFRRNKSYLQNSQLVVREHGMGGICNSIALHSPGLVPYCSTYLAFSDYMRAAMRVKSQPCLEAGVIYVMTHVCIGVGENGPTSTWWASEQCPTCWCSVLQMATRLLLSPGKTFLSCLLPRSRVLRRVGHLRQLK